jgi:GTP-binding protein
VGKSSLINALARRPLARTSAAPGKTRLANFYRLKRGNASAMYLVDLPGYGYARGGDAATGEFRTLTNAYFDRARPDAGKDSGRGTSGRETGVPIGVLLLVDARHPGLESDLDAWQWLRGHAGAGRAVGTGVIGTKVDKLTRAERARHARELETLFDIPVLLVSARTGEGLEELWKLIARLPSQTAA